MQKMFPIFLYVACSVKYFFMPLEQPHKFHGEKRQRSFWLHVCFRELSSFFFFFPLTLSHLLEYVKTSLCLGVFAKPQQVNLMLFSCIQIK